MFSREEENGTRGARDGEAGQDDASHQNPAGAAAPAHRRGQSPGVPVQENPAAGGESRWPQGKTPTLRMGTSSAGILSPFCTCVNRFMIVITLVFYKIIQDVCKKTV